MKKYFLYLVIVVSFGPWVSLLPVHHLHADSRTTYCNIVLISIDTLRTDHLSCYGYERNTTPHIDAIAEQGIIFKNVIAPSSWTAPSMASLFTSTYPVNHGLVHGIEYRRREQEVLSGALATLPEILQKHGYTTFGVSANHHLTEEFGFGRGFDHFAYLGWQNADMVNNTVYAWEEVIKESEKYFLWIHYNDPHIPYAARSPWIERYAAQSSDQARQVARKTRSHLKLKEFIPTLKDDPQARANLIALYDSEISYVDSHIGKLMGKFSLESDALIIITSDHGEEFLEHDNIGHGNNLHHETVSVPLIVKKPYSSKKKTVEQYVNLLDIMPTVLDLIKVNFPEQTLGKSFLAREGTLGWLKKIISGNDTPKYHFSELDRHYFMKSIMTPQWKYIYNYQDEKEHLYNLEKDPLELLNIFDKEPERCDQLKEQLFNWVSQSRQDPPKTKIIAFSPEEEEKLNTLGYID